MAKKKNSNKPKKQKIKNSFWRNIWAVIANKKDTDGQYTKATLVGLMSGALNTMAIILCLLAIVGVCGTIYQACIADWSAINLIFSNVVAFVILLLFCVVALIFALVLRGFTNEIERETDKNYIVSVFSGLTSFVALIVALIALFKGVG